MNAMLRRCAQMGGLAVLSGLLAGVGAWAFLVVLDAVTAFRVAQQWLVVGLPVAGVVTLWVVHRVSADSSRGNALVLEQLHRVDGGIPTTMAPIAVVGTWVTHLFGGSSGREGTALQMSASLTDAMSCRWRLDARDRRTLLAVAVAAGFGAVFGTPLAGVVYAMEVHSRWRLRWSILIPSVVAAFVGDFVVRLLGYDHTSYSAVSLGIDPSTFAACVVLGLGAGIVATGFVLATRGVRTVLRHTFKSAPVRAAAGGCVLVVLTAAFGTESQGLSLPLLNDAMSGVQLGASAFLLKIIFTAVTSGSGFIGGEVTPLFVIGATFGSAVATTIGLPGVATSALAFVAVFGAAAHVPLAGAVMAIELFGIDSFPHALVVCIVAALIARHPGLHTSPAHKDTFAS